ncbi:glycogen debranching N-terminal domain-containing protein [uncultured Arsenicicoccus sp.]|uniref:glycogen debranching N-terminal domain-containing protein n=1 Tax=uncultured Arsenicicoccus sp. TaxID=491339 RepID=UPI002594D340|nr:glycogen debranching N-terminal domain-containing protein [uncultured Arsenicicoccus sp.]
MPEQRRLTPDTPRRQPWLHELELAVHGNATALSTHDGTMGAPGTGVFVDDRRVVSRLAVLADGQTGDLVTSSSVGQETQVLTSLRHLGTPGPDPTVELRRTRVVQDAGMTETLRLTSRAAETVRTRLTVEIGGDGASLGAVKSGEPAGPLLPSMTAGARTPDVVLTWSDDRHLTHVTAEPRPTVIEAGEAGQPSCIGFDLEVPPGQTRSVRLSVGTQRLASSAFDADPGADLVDWSAVRVRAADTRLDVVVSSALEDLRHLTMRDPDAPDDVFAGAGSPWYLTLFGRDSVWAARLSLPFGTALAGGTLRTLARRQGRVDDPATAEQPGKILHEVRREQYVDDVTGLALPSTYYGTVDATSLWVCLLHDAWRHGLPEDEVRALLPPLRAALAWISRQVQDSPDGLLRYVDRTGTGLANQGWKDSGDSMRRSDGSIAPAPIALLEAQTYAVEAARKARALLAALDPGRSQEGEDLDRLADVLQTRVRQAFWVRGPRGPHLAMALDADGRPVDGIGSNMGHALGSGALTADEAALVADTLTGPDLLGPYGIATLSRSNPAYNPIGYHTGSVWVHDTAIGLLGLVAEGRAERAGDVARALVASSAAFGYRWPELYAGDPVLARPAPYPASCRPQAWSAASAAAVVTAVLGLRVDVPGRHVEVRPLPSLPFGPLTVSGLRYGPTAFAVSVAADGTTSVQGLPDEVTVSTG